MDKRLVVLWIIRIFETDTLDYHQGVENVSKLAPNKQLAFSLRLLSDVMQNVSFNLNFGKQKSEAKQRIQNSDTDTGILSGSK